MPVAIVALIVSLDRGAIKLDLGDFPAVVLAGDEVQLPGQEGKTIAKHLHNRWIATQEQNTPSSAFLSLNIAGPLTVVTHDGQESRLGPYLTFAMTDGILYVDQRILGMWDSEKKDWYVKDTGRHCKRFQILFHATD